MKKIIFIDLDGTLIGTASGETFPKGIWDLWIDWAVWKALKEYAYQNETDSIFVVSNQGGIEKGYVHGYAFEAKFNYILCALEEYTGINVRGEYCTSNDKDNHFRKPNTGMLEFLLEEAYVDFNKDEMIMIGDASGKINQFSDSDIKTAQNFGIDYMDVDDLLEHYYKPEE